MFNTNEFTYKDGVFSAEVSDFGHRWEELFKTLGRGGGLHGFRLESARTCAVITMVLVRAHYDRDDDVTHWTFKTIDHPKVKELIVFND